MYDHIVKCESGFLSLVSVSNGRDEIMKRIGWVLILACVMFAGLAGAADRVVLVEYFTSAT